MFRKANAATRNFTWPIVLSTRNVSGVCSSSIATFVVINDGGWVVTAAHVLKAFDDAAKDVESVAAHQASVQSIRNDTSLLPKERSKRLQQLGHLDPTRIAACSAWLGRDGLSFSEMRYIELVDLGVAKLEPFDPLWITEYPRFKDHTKEFEPGVGLCKLGFPFHGITPIWDQASSAFTFPLGALPLPIFPIEGIMTRTILLDPNNTASAKYPLMWVETSSPGLRGQSGGPTFDKDGAIWAIQSNTAFLPLGFEPIAPGTANQKEHQFLNVGRGVHSGTICGALDELKISYQLSVN
jgi:hypothetical protein